jgi:hypothetical protein
MEKEYTISFGKLYEHTPSMEVGSMERAKEIYAIVSGMTANKNWYHVSGASYSNSEGELLENYTNDEYVFSIHVYIKPGERSKALGIRTFHKQ